MELNKQVVAIRENCIETYHKSLSAELQPIMESVIKDLQVLYPKRNIYMLFGNGACVVNFEGAGCYNPCVNSYGNLNGWNESQNRIGAVKFFSLLDKEHPLIILMKILDELYNVLGYTPNLEDIR